MIKQIAGAVMGMALFFPVLNAQEVDKRSATKPTFEKATRLKGGDQFIALERPGYAAPAFFDVNRDGQKDLIVGQFADGKLGLYRGQEDGSFAKGEWLLAEGKTALVPDVW